MKFIEGVIFGITVTALVVVTSLGFKMKDKLKDLEYKLESCESHHHQMLDSIKTLKPN